MSPRSLTAVVTTYNWPQALAAVLESLARQDKLDYDVMVADDGSGPPTRELVQSFKTRFPVPLTHLWQPDDGPRVAALRNRAIEATQSEYIVFIDGDCLVPPDFVSRHRALAERGWFVAGKRSWLRPGVTARILTNPAPFAGNGRARWLMRSLLNQCTRPAEFLHLRCDRTTRSQDWRQAQTCNLGVWRDDCFAVNGFDERYLGVGLEDSDFALRLIRKGVLRKRGDHASFVLHLDHPRRSRPAESRSHEYFEELLGCDRFLAVSGIAENRTASVATAS